MPRITLIAAENLTPAQAAALVRVLDLQAEWQNLKDDGGDYSTTRLQGLQRTFEAFRVGLADYTARFDSEPMPEIVPTSPERLAVWCRVMRAVIQRAAPESRAGRSSHLVTRAYWLADHIASQLGKEPVTRKPVADTHDGVLAGLHAVGAWCLGLAAPLHRSEAHKLPSHESVPMQSG